MRLHNPREVIWIKRLLFGVFLLQTTLIAYIYYLSSLARQPFLSTDGFNRGVVESLMGIKSDAPIYLDSNVANQLAGKVTFYLLYFIVLTILVNKHKLKTFRGFLIVLLLSAIGNRSFGGVIIPTILLYLSFRKGAIVYFKSKE